MLPVGKFNIVVGFHILLQPKAILSHIEVFTSSMLTNVSRIDLELGKHSELPNFHSVSVRWGIYRSDNSDITVIQGFLNF